MYRFKCELLAVALFNRSALPLISNLFIHDPEEAGDRRSPPLKYQYRALKYRLRVAKMP